MQRVSFPTWGYEYKGDVQDMLKKDETVRLPEPKFITFVAMIEYKETVGWTVRNKRHGDNLGWIQWYAAWKQYVFSAADEAAVFSHDCLQDIAAFMQQETKARKGNVCVP